MKYFGYFLIALVAFSIFILVMAPASLLYSSTAGNLPDLKAANISGTAWQGDADLQYRSFPPVSVAWQLSALSLLTGEASASLQASGTGLTASTNQVSYGLGSNEGFVEDISAVVSGAYINQVTVNYGLDLSGEFSLKNTTASFNRDWLTGLQGELTWTGGLVHIETPSEFHTVKLPPLSAELSLETRTVMIDVIESASGLPLMQIQVKPDGWAAVAINHAFMTLAGLPLPTAPGSADPAVLLEEKVF